MTKGPKLFILKQNRIEILLATDTLRREPNGMQDFFYAHIFREGEMYVAYVPALDLSSCGSTGAEARRNIHEHEVTAGRHTPGSLPEPDSAV